MILSPYPVEAWVLGFTLGPLAGGFTAKLYVPKVGFMMSGCLAVSGLLMQGEVYLIPV